MPSRIEDYALVGDCEAAALIAPVGSVDWLCWPRFDSHACFAAMLGSPENGRWLIGPAEQATCSRRYVGETGVLEAAFTTPPGPLQGVDVMPIGDQRADIVRTIVGIEGTVRVRHEWIVRFGYGRIRP